MVEGCSGTVYLIILFHEFEKIHPLASWFTSCLA